MKWCYTLTSGRSPWPPLRPDYHPEITNQRPEAIMDTENRTSGWNSGGNTGNSNESRTSNATDLFRINLVTEPNNQTADDQRWTSVTSCGSPLDDFYDLSQIPYPLPMKSVPLAEAVLKVTFCAVIIAVAVLGNSAVILTVWKKKRLRSTTNYYIVNLAVSDLLVTISCTWVQVVHNLTEGWQLGAFFCKFNSFAQGKL